SPTTVSLYQSSNSSRRRPCALGGCTPNIAKPSAKRVKSITRTIPCRFAKSCARPASSATRPLEFALHLTCWRQARKKRVARHRPHESFHLLGLKRHGQIHHPGRRRRAA